MNDVLLKKWAETRQAHYSAFCVAPGNWLMLLFTMYLHFFKIECKINLFSWDFFNFECFLSQSVIFLALTGFYDWICKEVTHVWIEILFSWISSIIDSSAWIPYISYICRRIRLFCGKDYHLWLSASYILYQDNAASLRHDLIRGALR